MRRSTERILTTHTGSLPRPVDLALLLEAQEAGGASDAATFRLRVRAAVEEVVRKQRDTGIDIVNDGRELEPAGRAGDRLGEAGVAGRGCAPRVATALALMRQ